MNQCLRILFVACIALPSLTGQIEWEFSEIMEGTKPTIFADNKGVVHIASIKEDLSNGYVAYSNSEIENFETEIVNEGYYYGPIDINIERSGLVPLVCWHDHNAGDTGFRGELAFGIRNEADMWTIDIVEGAGHDGWDATFDIDEDNIFHVISTDPAGGIEYSIGGIGQWTQEAVDDRGAMYQYGTDIEYDDATDILHVTYFLDSESLLIYANRENGIWTLDTVASDGTFPKLVLTSEGPVIAYFQGARDNGIWENDGDVTIARRSGQDWTYQAVESVGNLDVGLGISGGAREIIDLQEDHNGRLHLAFANTDVVRYGIFENSSWNVSTVYDGESQGITLGQQVSLALDLLGRSHIVTYRRTQGNDGVVIYGKTQSTEVLCPDDITINCSEFITPDITGMPDSADFDAFDFFDEMIQDCPDDIILERNWIGFRDGEPIDTCIQVITIELDSTELFEIADTLRIEDQCIAELDDFIQTSLNLPCVLGIDSISVDVIEDSCERLVLDASWTFASQCEDTSVFAQQTIIIEDRIAAKLDAPVIALDTGSANGAITLIQSCPFDTLDFLWSTGDTSSSISSLAGDMLYTVTITNQMGCIDTLDFTVPLSVMMDTMVMDTMVMDTMVMDTMVMDTMVMDTMVMDTMVMDTMVMDTMVMDTMVMDTMVMDTMVMDTMVMDTMVMDTMMMDTMMMDTMLMGDIQSSIAISIRDRGGMDVVVDSILFLMSDSTLMVPDIDSLGFLSVDTTLEFVQGICFEKEGVAIEGLSVIDLTRGRRQVLQLSNGCAEDQVALDVSGEGSTSAFDLALMRSVLLDRRQDYPEGIEYRYVKSSPSFSPDQTSGACIILNNNDRIRGTLDVVEIKLGDLQCED